jgi:hypothetical protein
MHTNVGPRGVCHREGAFDLKVTPAAQIEQAERRIAPLLDLSNHETRADRVNGPGGNENNIAREYPPPRDKIHDRPIVDGFTQLPGRKREQQPERKRRN